MLRSVASGVVCCRRYAQLGGNRRLGFCIRIAPERSKSYWIGCVASDFSDFNTPQPTRDGEHPKLVVLSLVFRQPLRPRRSRCLAPRPCSAQPNDPNVLCLALRSGGAILEKGL